MALPFVAITGKVLTPSGQPAKLGRLDVRVSRPMRVSDGTVVHVIAPSIRIDLLADGSIPLLEDGTSALKLVPNDAADPSGTYYLADLASDRQGGGGAEVWKEKWQLASSPASLDIGAVPRIEGTPAAAYSVTAAVAQAIVNDATAAKDAAAASAGAAASSASAASGSAAAALAAQGGAEGAKTAAEAAQAAAVAARDAAEVFAGGRYPRRYPLFVEMVADFNSAGFATPTGLANHPAVPAQSGNYELKLSVSGAAGATTLTVHSGPIADCGGTSWAAVARHDDGSYGIYTVTGSDLATNLTIKPPLRKPVTMGVLANLHSSNLGQHYSPTGYKALAEHLWRYPALRAVRSGYIARADAAVAGNGPWTLLGGLADNRWDANVSANYFGSAAALATFAASRTNRFFQAMPTAAGSQGVEWTVSLLGKSGYVDSYVGAIADSLPTRVEVIVDGVTKLDKLSYGLERIAVPYTNAASGTIRFTFGSGDAGTTHRYRIGTTTWWETPADVPATLFFDGAKVVYVGDSWGAFYEGVGPAALGAHLAATGGSLVNVAVGGQTAQWARDNFQTLIADHNPQIAVIEFFVNDYNQLGAAGVDTWKANIYWLINECLSRGIQPVVVMPSPTASSTQAQGLTGYAAALAEGYLLQ